MRAALLQMTSGDDVAQNLSATTDMLREAAEQGAEVAFLPEVANCVSMSRAHQAEVLRPESEDSFLAGMRAAARETGLWIVACVAVKSEPPEARFANRCVAISPEGEISARYDKMHMFDVQVSETETYNESSGYAPGDRAVLAATPFGTLGLSICYDVRFAYLYRALARRGAQVLSVPAAFSPGTGPAHWQPLLQARAIETGSWVVAAAQTGLHSAQTGKSRRTYGHSMVVSPWGEVVLDAGTEPGVFIVDLDMAAVADARAKVPSLTHDRSFEGPL
ncbi:carbon-nitrogen hydrolase family protein [Tropicibacter naphthalenivorans]|uniref:(R)-stereoselective amidase n=1 Tax=Tropicibacter naphthalenivorans TaxID=441103 RepID=A0A0P1GD84_9RHOB|nr:carbon-nitrogen hydrolase family protein [Tropicibacter naphthalenivorans]CUH79568.1 (R)-stereoselective amidase [Tropicibacter naphthalenivorans]SMC73562.1 Predicted amidohydrolase [Tropicibacter naphthalenivorans]